MLVLTVWIFLLFAGCLINWIQRWAWSSKTLKATYWNQKIFINIFTVSETHYSSNGFPTFLLLLATSLQVSLLYVGKPPSSQYSKMKIISAMLFISSMCVQKFHDYNILPLLNIDGISFLATLWRGGCSCHPLPKHTGSTNHFISEVNSPLENNQETL